MDDDSRQLYTTPDMDVTEEQLRDAERMLAMEWIDVNGAGGYSSSTVTNRNTRKYHGVLIANLAPPASGRHVLLSSLADTLVSVNNEELPVTPLQAGTAEGSRLLLCGFRSGLFPSWRYRGPGVDFEKALLMPAGTDAVLIRYRFRGVPDGWRLRLRPLLAYRRNHELMQRHDFINSSVTCANDGFSASPFEGMPRLCVRTSHDGPVDVVPVFEWEQGIYPVEAERGYPDREDQFLLAVMDIPLTHGAEFIVSASACPLDDLAEAWSDEERRRERRSNRIARIAGSATGSGGRDQYLLQHLIRAADQLLIVPPSGRSTVLAGYHWFEDWGRDTLIALPGLAFCTGRLREGFDALCTFIDHEKDGLIPNFIGADDAPSYNSVDAALWLFWTTQQFLKAGGDIEAVRGRIWPVIKRVVHLLADGAAENVFMTPEGLLHSGSCDTQLTWMDAHANGRPVTPRWGFAVELNALWYNALCFAVRLAHRLGDLHFSLPVEPEMVAEEFRLVFWHEDRQCLADVVNEEGVDDRIRPNQIFAVSLPHSPIDPEQQRAVVACVQEHLFTPRGLRTLAPQHPEYRGHYGGDQTTRDRAYHQGTAWPWLLGAFGQAYLQVNEYSDEARAFIRDHLRGWLPHLSEAGIGTVSEVFDGDPPHRPGGCISQAWSLAELIRLHFLLADRSPGTDASA